MSRPSDMVPTNLLRAIAEGIVAAAIGRYGYEGVQNFLIERRGWVAGFCYKQGTRRPQLQS